MNKAFIFDLDGVLIDDEQIWETKKQALYKQLFGEEIANKIGSTVGINFDDICELAIGAGAKLDRKEIKSALLALADDVYQNAPIPEGIDKLAEQLINLDYHIGIVSASPLAWITAVTKRLSFEANIELIISLYERDDLAHKPAPDGYLEAIKVLGASPESTIILEDSNSGIKAAKASGALTVGLKQNLTSGYVQEGADKYAGTLKDVVQIVSSYSSDLE